MKETIPAQPNLPTEWIVKLKANDDQALRTLYGACYPGIEHYILQNNGSKDDAKDIYQEAFIAMWRNIQLDKVSFTGLEQLQGYIFRIAQYKWLDQLRSSRVKKTNPLNGLDIAEEVPAQLDKEEAEYLAKVKLHYVTIGDQCREVLNRFYFLKQSMAEIASFFSWTEATAKNNKYRCLQKLRNLILVKNNTI